MRVCAAPGSVSRQPAPFHSSCTMAVLRVSLVISTTNFKNSVQCLQDGTQWRTFCNDCVKEMGPLGKVQEIQVRFAFDAVRVQVNANEIIV